MVFAAFHPDVPVGSYLLLLDQVRSPFDARSPFADGDPAIFTMGPTLAAGATSALSLSEVETPVVVAGPDGRDREVRGFPVDRGLIGVLSTTPGVLTQITGTTGVRLTVRVQY